jgi:hypothetical protein
MDSLMRRAYDGGQCIYMKQEEKIILRSTPVYPFGLKKYTMCSSDRLFVWQKAYDVYPPYEWCVYKREFLGVYYL